MRYELVRGPASKETHRRVRSVPRQCKCDSRSTSLGNVVERAWRDATLDVVVATSAFGLGIDSPHVRFVLITDAAPAGPGTGPARAREMQKTSSPTWFNVGSPSSMGSEGSEAEAASLRKVRFPISPDCSCIESHSLDLPHPGPCRTRS
ncbi:ATP-dependent DNA helicase [Pycnococcus provasolii]